VGRLSARLIQEVGVTTRQMGRKLAAIP